MFHIDRSECIRCGSCIEVCPKRAITMHSGSAMINEDLCIQCGACADVCPVGAIHEVVLADTKLSKGGEIMQYGYREDFVGGFGYRGGAGLGFRGSSPPWPYSGRGRGGLPRCWYSGVTVSTPYTPIMTREEEIDWLKSQAAAIKRQLEQIETRIQSLTAKKE